VSERGKGEPDWGREVHLGQGQMPKKGNQGEKLEDGVRR